jgi:hypothetical protein
MHPILGSVIMLLCVETIRFFLMERGIENLSIQFISSIVFGAVAYICYFLLLEKKFIASLKTVFREKKIGETHFIPS